MVLGSNPRGSISGGVLELTGRIIFANRMGSTVFLRLLVDDQPIIVRCRKRDDPELFESLREIVAVGAYFSVVVGAESDTHMGICFDLEKIESVTIQQGNSMSTTVEDLDTALMWGDQRQLYSILYGVARRARSSEQEAAKMIREWWIAEMAGEGILTDLEPATIVKALYGFEFERVIIAIRAAERRDVGKRDAQKRLIETAIKHADAFDQAPSLRIALLEQIEATEHYRAVFGLLE